VQDVCGNGWWLVGKSVGWSLFGRWSTGARRGLVRGVGRGRGGGMARGVVCVDGAFGVQSWTTPLRRSLCATSTAAERGQVPEREAPGPRKKFWRVRPQGEPPRSRHARSSCEPIRDLRPWSGGGTDSVRERSRLRPVRHLSRVPLVHVAYAGRLVTAPSKRRT